MEIEEIEKRYKEKMLSIDSFLKQEEVMAQQRMYANADYYQAVLSTVSRLREHIKKL